MLFQPSDSSCLLKNVKECDKGNLSLKEKWNQYLLSPNHYIIIFSLVLHSVLLHYVFPFLCGFSNDQASLSVCIFPNIILLYAIFQNLISRLDLHFPVGHFLLFLLGILPFFILNTCLCHFLYYLLICLTVYVLWASDGIWLCKGSDSMVWVWFRVRAVERESSYVL
jgi:hypothetical protein